MRASRGSVFILAVWATVFTALLALAVVSRAAATFRVAADVRDRVVLRAAQTAAVKKAQAYLSRGGGGPEALQDEWSSGVSASGGAARFKDVEWGAVRYDYLGRDGRHGFVDEESKIHLNTVPAAVLQRLIAVAAVLPSEEAKRIAEAVVDWRDPDTFAAGGGTENAYYGTRETPFVPRNGPIRALEELRLVPGVDAKTYARLVPYLTVHGTGRINVNTAPEPVLTALGLNPALSRKIARFRAGKDAAEGTMDDAVIGDLTQLAERMRFEPGLTMAEQLELASAVQAGRLTVDSDHFTIVVEMRHGKRRQRVACVTDRRSQILEWRE